MKKGYKKDFQSWKGYSNSKITLLQYSQQVVLIGRNIVRHSLIVVRRFALYRYIVLMDR